MKNKKKIFDLSSDDNKRKLFDILSNFNSKKEAYSFLGVNHNTQGMLYLKNIANEIGFDLNNYVRKRPTKQCLNCGNYFIQKYKNQKFCSCHCSATYNNKMRSHLCDECRHKISESLKKYHSINRKKINNNKCPICGNTNCKKNGICSHTKKFFNNLAYFGFNLNCLGSNSVFNEFTKIKEVLENEYFNNHLSPSDLKKKYNYPKSYENITHILKAIGIKTRNLSNCNKNGIVSGNIQLPKSIKEIKLGFKQGWHTTWDNKKFFYRSSYELKYAESLDKEKIPYEIETLRIEYYDSIKKCNRIAIPDFLLINTNEIVEIKSKITFKKQNILDKFKKYKELGYTPKLIYEGQTFYLNEINSIEENIFTI